LTQLIEERLSSDKVDIGYLADIKCAMSNSTLYRKMKALTGLSTNEYIRKMKIEARRRSSSSKAKLLPFRKSPSRLDSTICFISGNVLRKSLMTLLGVY
jgi:hypothetical protein